MRPTRLSFDLFLSCIVFTLLARPAVAGGRQLDPYCQDKGEGKVSDESVNKKYEQEVGFNPAQYITQRYVSSPWRLAGAASLQPGELVRARERFRTDKLKEFISERGAAVLDVPATLDLVDRTGFEAAIQSRSTALSKA